jgi:hypothetical protein
MLAPAYDSVSTIAYLPADRLALTFVDSKEFSSLTLDQFRRFAAKARLPEKLTLDTVQETVSRFSQAWRESDTLKVPTTVRKAIDRHLPTLPAVDLSVDTCRATPIDFGRREIRTHGGIAPSPVFKTGALNHSASLPDANYSVREKMPLK